MFGVICIAEKTGNSAGGEFTIEIFTHRAVAVGRCCIIQQYFKIVFFPFTQQNTGSLIIIKNGKAFGIFRLFEICSRKIVPDIFSVFAEKPCG